MLNKLLSLIRQYDMVQQGDTVVCAVSGGADSTAMLFAMYLLREKLGITLEAAHFNHHLRGEESDRDEAFVRALCDRYDIPLHVGGGQVTAGAKGLEAAAREARYAFLTGLRGKIATAHTADDNAETVLMHIVRGTGLQGLGAICPIRGNLIRPMLLVTRAQVLSFLEEYHISYVTDSSNAADQFLRNRLRHHVMPLLAAENPRLAENLSEMALRLRWDEEVLSAMAAVGDDADVQTLRWMPQAVRCRWIAAFLKRHGVKEPETEHITLVERLIFASNPSARAHLPGGVTVARRYGSLTAAEETPPLATVPLSCPGSVLLPGGKLRVICEAATEPLLTTDAFTVIPEGRMVVRCRQAGDVMRLRGGRKELKKLFIDRKIPASERLSIPVIADDGGVLGVHRIGANLERVGQGVLIRFETV